MRGGNFHRRKLATAAEQKQVPAVPLLRTGTRLLLWSYRADAGIYRGRRRCYAIVMAPPLLSLRGVAMAPAERTLFADLDLAIGGGERLCLVGRNGSGKSTLLKLLAGELEADAGERFAQPGSRIAYLPQEPDLSGHDSIEAYVASGAAPERRHRAGLLLHALGLDGGRGVVGLSGGEARRAALARTLVDEPDVLLLDEPTNHLDIRAIEWLEEELARLDSALVLVSHDRQILRRLSRACLWLERGRLYRLERGFDAFEDWSATLMDQESEAERKLDKRIAEETRWSHEGITARRRRNQGRLRRLHEMRAERARRPAAASLQGLAGEAGGRSGRLVIEAVDVAKSFGDKPLLRDVSTRIMRGDKVGLIGPNGAGKTTLLRLLTGQLAPDQGQVRLGSNLQTVYLDQGRARLAGDPTVQQVLCERGGDQVYVRGEGRHVASYLGAFLFAPAIARARVSTLSGGERNRLLLAWALAQPANLLVLDEPTNDLDMETLDLLQEMLADFDGTVLLVSHDRDFLDRVVTSTIVLEGDGLVREYPGGYSDYRRQRRVAAPAPVAAAAAKPSGAAPKPRQPGRKLSYKQQHRLDELSREMPHLERAIASLQAELADEDAYARDPDGYLTLAGRLEAAQAALSAAEEEWLELEALRESLATGGIG